MSFMGGGAECSTGRNPLAQLSKIGSVDKSNQRDRMVEGRGPMGQEAQLRSQGGAMGQMDQQV